jgi:hypothetical protein
VKPSTVRNSLLAAGIMAAVGAAVYFKGATAAPTAGGETSMPEGSSRKSTATSTRPVRAVTRSFASESDPGFQTFLKSLEQLAGQDSKQALVQLAEIKDPELLAPALAAIARGWAAADPDAAATWLLGLEPEKQVDAATGLIPVWVDRSPDDCLRWVGQCPMGDLREVAMVEAADAWSSKDPQAAFARFLTLGNEDGTERGLQAIVSQWAQDAPDAAVNYLAKLEDPSQRDEFLQAALASLSNKDPELAWKYCDRFADPETAEQTRGTVLEAIAESRPQDAIKLAESGGNGEDLLEGIARGWATLDDEAAKAWIQSLPDPEMVKKLLEAIAE